MASAPLSAVERALEQVLFQSRWLLAPLYLGLVGVLAIVVWAFFKELAAELSHLGEMTPDGAVIAALSLIDLSLTGNLLLIVIFSGYESFVSRIDTGENEDRPKWMGEIGFSQLKLKLMASLAAISAVALLRALWRRANGDVENDLPLYLLIAIHLTFVVSAVLLALMEWLQSKTRDH